MEIAMTTRFSARESWTCPAHSQTSVYFSDLGLTLAKNAFKDVYLAQISKFRQQILKDKRKWGNCSIFIFFVFFVILGVKLDVYTSYIIKNVIRRHALLPNINIYIGRKHVDVIAKC